MGSAVDPTNLTRELQRYAEAGWGGVHIIPIYGAKGWEDRYLEYLGPPWMAMLRHTVSEAARLGLGVDMTTGTGWCFGGPTVFLAPFRVVTGPLQAHGNVLEVEVTSTSANRIRDLDRRQVAWRNFHDINFVNLNYKSFDASNWSLADSGLLGPVTLQPVVPLAFGASDSGPDRGSR